MFSISSPSITQIYQKCAWKPYTKPLYLAVSTVERPCSPVENCKFLGKLVSSDNRYFIVDYGRLGVPEHISAGCSDCTLGENILEAKFKMAANILKKYFKLLYFPF